MGKRISVMLVFGTRPEAIKMCPLVKEFQKNDNLFETIVCVTGQHRQLLDSVLEIFDVKPDYDLDIMKAGQDLTDITSRILTGMRDTFCKTRPDIVLVHGDTTTSMAAALASFYEQIPVGHIEAGLRTHNIYSPWPEEMNRQITGRIARCNFTPSPFSQSNLLKENVPGDIFVTGNTVIDALHMVLDKIDKNKPLENKVREKLIASGYDINRTIGSNRKMVLITGHRRENFGDGFINICTAIRSLCEKYPDIDFVYPMHLNPNVRNAVNRVFGDNSEVYKNLFLIEPVQYIEFVYMMNHAYLVLTDSGGIQEEAPALGKPVLVMRDTTERPEAVEAGTALLVGTDKEAIVREVSRLVEDAAHYRAMHQAVNPYGDGTASRQIVELLNHIYKE